ncbi:MAG: 50S ribosomal protein L21 [Ardenticatenia bacterium]|uniref:Large ribosomal subunit protein bL21 n=1 Tax=Ardenticatena maritima TaxID=872965 RepID=A0A0M8KBN5_9CHLR|nr:MULTISPECIES: 50S ribosomal protein L21 [Ardenticatena]KPL88377.1 50S ribosomal protein L21 [Ardenticatena maritima]RME09388.1 MAG: 50S ribosomal protein L21 [Ardenticatenia bacterium]GAP64449.1 large subunit ribosomal protein L21 [Ardenticatena maritima]
MYAVIETGGKQYRVEEGATITVERLPVAEGEQVTFDRVLFVGGDEAKVGTPVVEGAKVIGTVLEHTKDKKKIIFRYRRKQRYRVKRGHRQPITRVKIESIEA